MNKKDEKINQEFIKVAKEFFPEWDRNGWTAVSKVNNDENLLQGYCDTPSKTIEIFEWWKMDGCTDWVTDKPVPFEYYADYLDSVLIHEMCHAILFTKGKGLLAHGLHNYHWFELMGIALEHAKSIGRVKLTELIERNIKKYKAGGSKACELHEWSIDDLNHAAYGIHSRKAGEKVGYLKFERR
jgi:hypothetical protein